MVLSILGGMLGLNPHNFSRGYYAIHLICRLIMFVFFRKVHLVGKESIPKTGGVILCGTHSNQFVDAMVDSSSPRS